MILSENPRVFGMDVDCAGRFFEPEVCVLCWRSLQLSCFNAYACGRNRSSAAVSFVLCRFVGVEPEGFVLGVELATTRTRGHVEGERAGARESLELRLRARRRTLGGNSPCSIRSWCARCSRNISLFRNGSVMWGGQRKVVWEIRGCAPRSSPRVRFVAF